MTKSDLYQHEIERNKRKRKFPQDKKSEHVKCWKASIILLKQYQKFHFDYFFKFPNTKTNKITFKFTGTPDVNLSFILSKKKKKISA